jgi:hypothetical protein
LWQPPSASIALMTKVEIIVFIPRWELLTFD